MELLQDSRNALFLSVASIWEVAIKANLGRGLELNDPFAEFIDEQLSGNSFVLLNIRIAHLKSVAVLPTYHRDPFDRMIIAQSLVENIPIITSDRVFDNYPVQRVW